MQLSSARAPDPGGGGRCFLPCWATRTAAAQPALRASGRSTLQLGGGGSLVAHVLAVQRPGGVAPTQERLLEEQAGPGAVLVRRLQQRR